MAADAQLLGRRTYEAFAAERQTSDVVIAVFERREHAGGSMESQQLATRRSI